MSGMKILVGTINGAVAMMAVSFLIWSVLLADYFSTQMPGVEALDPQNHLFQILAASVHAMLVTIFLHRKEASSLGACMKDAALLGALMWLGVESLEHGILWNVDHAGCDGRRSTLFHPVRSWRRSDFLDDNARGIAIGADWRVGYRRFSLGA